MKFIDALGLQPAYLLDSNTRRNHLARLCVVFEPCKALTKPVRDCRAAALGEALQLGESGNRQDAGHDVSVNAGYTGKITKSQVDVCVEKELSDGARCSGIDLAFEVLKIGYRARRFGRPF